MTRFTSYRYQPGGSLPSHAPTYVTRQADRDLLAALLQGSYCYVLNSRQMGKSSLRVRVMEQLEVQGIATVEIELLGIGSQQITATQWYGGIIAELISGLDLEVNRQQWLKAHNDLSPVQCLGRFVETVVLEQVTQPLVIFFDEIDSVLGLEFPTDNFFGLIRSWYERRATQPIYQRLSVVMLGVATPSALMKNEQSTPFNIGQAIDLKGFQSDEAKPLALGLAPYADKPELVLRNILDWTGGQPFLTQKLCWLVTQQKELITTGNEQSHIDRLVRSHIIDNWDAQDEPEHLRTVRDRILRSSSQPDRLLQLYRGILRRSRTAATDSLEQRELCLTGLVRRHRGQLIPFNRIYETIFNLTWVNHQLRRQPAPTPRLARRTLWAGVGSALLIIGLRNLGLLQGLEVWAYDQMHRGQPKQPADERFLIITVSEADIQYQDQLGLERQGSLSDDALLKILEAVAPYRPRVIGMDIHHPFPFQPELVTQLQANNTFVPICEIGVTVDVGIPVSIPAPPGLSVNTLGFADLVVDTDYRVRRQLLGMDRTEACSTSRSFNVQIALQYLEAEDIELEFLSDRQIRLGEALIPKLSRTAGGYWLSPTEQKGFQTLATYRTEDPIQISLSQVLRQEVDAELMQYAQDGIVLIGVEQSKDALFVPGRSQRMLGVVTHAHLASQLIDAAQGRAPLRWWWHDWTEIVWIIGWGSLSSLVVGVSWIKWRSRWGCVTVAAALNLILGGICYGVLVINHGWIPIIPNVIAMSLASGVVIVLTSKQHHRGGFPWLS
ncbi:MAG: CHASE2 domain-containing protein [Cyanobacteria bacterium J06627_8]